MKFGAVHIDRAEGAILAHSVPLAAAEGGPKHLRKGKTLSADDIELLRQADVRDVTVAQLGPSDVDENTAATRVAAALVGQNSGLRVGDAGTGRVNIFAKQAGIAALQSSGIHALNAVDPMITVATVPDYARMTAGGMIATVKIISYGVAEPHVARAEAAGRGAIDLLTPTFASASFIETGAPNGADKGFEATQDRLAAFDVPLHRTPMIPHETEALAAAISAAQDDFILILTASATSDIADVAPAALMQAGGEVTCFGMPVDPGNLLFFGKLGSKTVIGLPGCARSPALNGADWVLERLICGVAVSQEDISRMGVGGLLKEIPTRPHPRRKTRG